MVPQEQDCYQYHDTESPLGDEPPPQAPSRIRSPMRPKERGGGGEEQSRRGEGCKRIFAIIAPVSARSLVSHLHGDPSVDAVPQTDAGW